MARPVKCPVCSESFDRDVTPFTEKNGRYYHNQCLNQQQREADVYKDLIAYICDLRNLKAPTSLMTTQIKKFKEELGFTYSGMKLALYYYHEVLRKPIINDIRVGVGIIEYVYEDARKFFTELHQVQTHNKELSISNEPVQYKAKFNKGKKINKKKVDLEELFNE